MIYNIQKKKPALNIIPDEESLQEEENRGL